MGHCLTDCPSNTDGVVWQLRVNIAHTVTLSIHTEQINIQIPYLPIKQFRRRCHLPLPKVVIARWRTARVIISLFLSNQSQRSSFAVIGYAEAGRRRSPTTCRLLYRRIPQISVCKTCAHQTLGFFGVIWRLSLLLFFITPYTAAYNDTSTQTQTANS